MSLAHPTTRKHSFPAKVAYMVGEAWKHPGWRLVIGAGIGILAWRMVRR